MRKKIAYIIKRTPIIGKHYPSMRKYVSDRLEEFDHYRDSVFNDYSKKKPVKTKFGFLMHTGHGRYHELMADGSFEIEETELMIQLMKDADVYVDVGANIGYYVLLARSLGKHAIAIEPQIKNVKIMSASLIANKYYDVEVYPLGLAEKPGMAKLYGASSTGASLVEGWNEQSTRVVSLIPLTTLDIIISRFVDKKILIKVDVEGAEYNVLRGAVNAVKHLPKPKWLIEVTLNEYYPDKINPDYQNIFDFFWKNGYKIYTANKEQRLVSPDDVARWIKNKKNDFGVINYIAQ